MSDNTSKALALDSGRTVGDSLFHDVPRNVRNYPRYVEREIKKILDARAEAAEAPIDEDRVLLRITSPEVLAACERADRAVVEAAALADMARVAKRRLDLELETVLQLIREEEPVDPGSGWSVDHMRRLVLKPDSSGADDKLSAVLDVCEAVVRLDEEALKGVRDGVVPDDWQDAIGSIPGTHDLVKDLADFVLEAGSEGVAFARGLFDDELAAKRAATDQRLPKPLRLLAGILCKVRHQ